MVVDFAVEEYVASAVLVRHRLRAAGAIDDREAAMTECGSRVRVVPLAVGTAMPEGARHRRHRRVDCRIERAGECEDAADAAHGFLEWGPVELAGACKCKSDSRPEQRRSSAMQSRETAG